MSSDTSTMVAVPKKGTGLVAGIFACVFGILGIISFGLIFVPLAVIVGAIGLFIAFKNKNNAAIGVNILAFVLAVIGFASSPSLWAIFAASQS